MNSIRSVRINYSLIAMLLFTAASWLGLYALWDNFAAQGVELIRRGGILSTLEGGALIALHAFGLVLVLGCCIGVIAVAVRSQRRESSDHHRYPA